MSGDYLVLVSHERSAAREAAVDAGALLREAGWTRRLQRGGIDAWTRGVRPPPVRWCDEAGAVLIGVTHPATMQRRGFPTPTPPEGPAGRAAGLCRRLWGRYVAVFPEDGAERPCGFRDPSGALDAATWTRGMHDVLASGLLHVPQKLRPPNLALDWDAITDFVRRPAALAGRLGLSGLASLAPGDLRPLGEAGVASAVWRPLDWIADKPVPRAVHRARLAEAVCGAVVAVSGSQSRILTEISGGLDSSIVNACLASGGGGDRVAAALHYVGDRADSDERGWAAMLCDRWSLPMACTDREVGVIHPELDFAPLARDLRPPVAALDSWRDRHAAAQLERHAADGLLTGMGGDAVFFQMPTARVLSDLWRARGLAGLAEPAWRDIARWRRRSVWSTSAEAMRALRRAETPATNPFVGPRVREPVAHAAHPWLDGAERAPPGKRLQLEALAGLQLTLGRNRRSEVADVLHPLLAQPVMEAVLPIPSWVLVHGGRDRGLARDAFSDILPAQIVARRSKGSLTSLFSRRVAASLDVLRPYLLDGVLVGAGVLDRAAVEAALDVDRLIWRSDGLQLVRAIAVEAWVRHWQTRVPDSPQAPRDRR